MNSLLPSQCPTPRLSPTGAPSSSLTPAPLPGSGPGSARDESTDSTVTQHHTVAFFWGSSKRCCWADGEGAEGSCPRAGFPCRTRQRCCQHQEAALPSFCSWEIVAFCFQCFQSSSCMHVSVKNTSLSLHTVVRTQIESFYSSLGTGYFQQQERHVQEWAHRRDIEFCTSREVSEV